MATKHILSIGIPPPDQVKHGLENSKAKVKDDFNIDVELFYFDAKKFEETEIENIGAKLRSRKWDGVVVGGGVRLNPDMTEIFEKVVNSAHEFAPQARMGFNQSGEDLYECVKRGWTGMWSE